GVLPGVVVELRLLSGGAARETLTSSAGEYSFADVAPGRYQLSFALINFATLVRRDIDVASSSLTINVLMHLAMNAEVTVNGERAFVNLADAENPAENLVGIAQAASQGAITAEQLDIRPLMRIGEVLESVPG